MNMLFETLPLFAVAVEASRPVDPAVPAKAHVGPPGCRRCSQRAFEAWLRKRGDPFIAVDEVRKAVFADADIPAFHFLVYRNEGPNFLVHMGDRSVENIAALAEWERIFGVDFKATFARMNTRGDVRYIGLDGNDVAHETLNAKE